MNTEYQVGALSALGEDSLKGSKRSKKLANLFEKGEKHVSLFRETDPSYATSHSTRLELAPLETRRKWHEDGNDSDDGKEDPALEKPTISKRKLHKQRLKRRLNPDVLPRTIFVGNLPIATTKKKLIKIFKKFGSIESARIRCAPVADEKTPKRVAAITRQYHPESESIIGYVKFTTSEEASKALAMNGNTLGEHHLRVDLAKGESLLDHERSVFVGNIPFNVQEESLQRFFEDAGKIESVRVIRDSMTRVGKGFGYVLFEDRGSVELALRANNAIFEGREIRVKRSTRNPKPYLPPKIPSTKKGKFYKMLRQRQEEQQSKLANYKLQQKSDFDTPKAKIPKQNKKSQSDKKHYASAKKDRQVVKQARSKSKNFSKTQPVPSSKEKMQTKKKRQYL